MFGRRVPPNVVFLLSLLLAVVCGLIAYRAFTAHNQLGAIIAGLFAVWFAVDAVRSFGWARRR
ncbi:MAG: hypothetical protein Q4C89_01195 [Deinococcus sp.]|uniref:hypothetical protein n=1 Tax=Deinococcus sp. TaxID=47478 RepID=UPI0026DD2280|nr:hypothetical protein [Deinococcus sp.]MDO4244625.1 hypothetical protein [Deinococcus sp.]